MKNHALLSLLACIAATCISCSLGVVPTCITDTEKCEYDSVISSALYSVCDANGDWSPRLSCTQCNGNTCDQTEFMACDISTPDRCEVNGDISIQLNCWNNVWMPTLCLNGCDGNSCAGAQAAASCQEGKRMCSNIDYLNTSALFTCYGNEWVPQFCPEGYECDGDSCVLTDKCQNDDLRCIEDDSGARIQKCIKNKWQDEPDGKCMTDNQPVSCADSPKCYEVLCKNGYAETNAPENPDKTIKAFCINSYETLSSVRDAWNQDGHYPSDNNDNAYILQSDITLPADGETGWIPWGTEDKPFNGIFLGNHKKITFTKSFLNDNKLFGLFGKLAGDENKPAYVSHLILDGNLLQNRQKLQRAGLLAGLAEFASVSHIEFSGSIGYDPSIKSDSAPDPNYGGAIGGLIGRINNQVYLDDIHNPDECNDCLNLDTINAYTGGVIGQSYNKEHKYASKLNNIKIHVTIKTDRTSNGYNYIPPGGIIGQAGSGDVKEDYEDYLDDTFYTLLLDNIESYGSVSSNTWSGGGVIGYAVRAKVTHAHSDFNLSGITDLAPIIGKAIDSQIIASSASGEVSADIQAGGITGRLLVSKNMHDHNPDFASIIDSYSNAYIKNGSKCGGITGDSGSAAKIVNSYHIGKLNNGCGGIIGELCHEDGAECYMIDSNTFIKNSYHAGTNDVKIIRQMLNTNVCSDETCSNLSVNNAFIQSTQGISSYMPRTFSGNYGQFIISSDQAPVISDHVSSSNTSYSQSLTDNLGSAFILAKCKTDLGDGENTYLLPVLKDNMPDDCTACTTPGANCPSE